MSADIVTNLILWWNSPITHPKVFVTKNVQKNEFVLTITISFMLAQKSLLQLKKWVGYLHVLHALLGHLSLLSYVKLYFYVEQETVSL